MKRNADELSLDDAGKKQKLEDENKMETRWLIDNRQVGTIIGREGSNVIRIRKDTGVFISVLRTTTPIEKKAQVDRVLTLTGTPEGIAAGARVVAQIFIQADFERAQKKAAEGGDVPIPSGTCDLRLLFQQVQTGAIIGKAGAVIREIQEQTGVKMRVSNEPIENSTEKSVTFTGTPEQVHDAIYRVVNQLKANPPRPGTNVVLFEPGAAPAAAYAAYPYGAANLFPGYAPYGYSPVAAGGGNGGSSQKIAIPVSTAGSVIGKGGSVISDIKAKSGCTISLADASLENPDERVATITGSQAGIQHAVNMIRQIVETCQPGARPSQIPTPAYAAPAYAPAAGYAPQAAYAAYAPQPGYAAPAGTYY
jgi:poly(rC)-binding protein 2/3/4